MSARPPLLIVDQPLAAQAYQRLFQNHHIQALVLNPSSTEELSFPHAAFLLVEIHLPQTCGLLWAHHLHRQHPHLHIISWTTHPSSFHLWLAHHWGFPAFLDKAMPATDVLHSLHLMLQGYTTWPLHLLQRALLWGQTIAPILTALPSDLWHLWNGLLLGEDVDALSQRLGCSEGTVRRKRKVLYERLQVRGWAEAVRKACTWGLTEIRNGHLTFRRVVWEVFGGQGEDERGD